MEQGSLYDLIHNETMDFDGEILLKLLVDIAHGVQFLHNTEPQIIHGDLRSHNILVDSRFRAKVAGFGAVTRTERHSSSSYWMAPEVLRKESAPTAASDVYSFGIILYEIYSRKDPYHGEDRKTVLHDICDPLIHKRPIVPLCMKSRVSDIMHDCLVETPEERPSLHEIGNRLRRFDPDHVEPVGFVKRTRQVSIDSLMRKFPRRIAEALRDGREVEPEHHDCVTMCVFDVHGDFSQVLSSEKVTDLVRRLFSQFEELSDFHDVYKVETVGDAWMGVTNLVQKQPDDHMKHMIGFAKDIMRAATETMIDVNNPALGYVQLRIGIVSCMCTSPLEIVFVEWLLTSFVSFVTAFWTSPR
jgi:serine/threonine protein kinase